MNTPSKNTPPKSTVLCFSGGLDSSVLLAHLLDMGHTVHALNISYGSLHNASERKRAAAFAKKYQVSYKEIHLDFVDKLFDSALLQSGPDLPLGHYSDRSMRQTVVPGRNTIFLSIAIGYAESVKAQNIAIANHADDAAMYPDTTPEWVAAMRLAAYHGTYQRISLAAPFTHWSKADICKRGNELGVDFTSTWTCYSGGDTHCGKCGACSSRKEAFKKAGLTDPTTYLA